VNSTLWLLYLADVVAGLQVVIGIGAGIALLYAGAARLFTAIDEEPCPASVKPAIMVGVVAALTCAIIPSQTTLYAIAAANLGEKALETPTGDKAIRALNAWLDRQIADTGKKDK
jgi:hypothetical protein